MITSNPGSRIVAALFCYAYDGLNRRIKKTVGNAVTRSFFNANWQEIESRKGNVGTTYVWGLRYVDDLVSREKDDVRLYALQDANWNVVALCNIDGVVVERYTYDGFGKRNALMNSGIDFDRAFTGQVLDAETGLMLYRNRYYSTSLGRFLTRDPIGYDAADPNLYRYVKNRVVKFVDPFGLQNPLFFAPIQDQGHFMGQLGNDHFRSQSRPPITQTPSSPKPSPRDEFYAWTMGAKSGPVLHKDDYMTDAFSQHTEILKVMLWLSANLDVISGESCGPTSPFEQINGPHPGITPTRETEYLWQEFSVRPDFNVRGANMPQVLREAARFGEGALLPNASPSTQLQGSMGSMRYTWEIVSVDWQSQTFEVRFQAFNVVAAPSGSYGLLPESAWYPGLDQTFEWTQQGTWSRDYQDNLPVIKGLQYRNHYLDLLK